jgi:hypothetical protein
MILAAVALVVVAGYLVMSGGSVFVAVLPVAIAIGLLLLRAGRRDPTQMAIVVAAVTLGAGTLGALGIVVDGVAHSQVRYEGTVDLSDVREAMHPGPDPVARWEQGGYTYLDHATGTAIAPDASSGLVSFWALLTLAPWVVGVVAFVYLLPVLRAARNDPFGRDLSQRLVIVGSVLLFGLPLLATGNYVVAEAASSLGVLPHVSPVLRIEFADVFPGAMLLALAGVFRAGASLRDFERHAV